MFKVILLCLVILRISISCSESDEGGICSISGLESQIENRLADASTDVDFSYYIENTTGRNFSYNKGASTLNTVYESASTSKWVTAAVILRVVENISGFDLSDKPSDHYAWTMGAGDPLFGLTLDQALSFTSGLQDEASCLTLGVPVRSFDACIADIVTTNESQGYTPGSAFYYSSSHMQIAGAMAVAAQSEASWESLFDEFQSSTGLFPNSEYNLPRVANPRLAGGMSWTGNDYIGFLRSIMNNTLLSAATRTAMFADHVGSLTILSSPALDSLGENWHYGYGVWLECNNASCSEVDYYSSPGAYGAYPFISLNKNYFGLIARQGALGTFKNGYDLFEEVRELSEEWAECTTP